MEDIANPEAPNGSDHCLEEDLTAVSGTLYAKAWLLDLLVRLVKEIERKPIEQLSSEDEDELDDILVKLWDVSTEPPVALFLAENQVFDILLPACLNCDVESKSRQVEIALGTLANTVSIRETGLTQKIAETEFYMEAIVAFFSKFSNDAEVLIQCCRLLNACFCCESSDFAVWEKFLVEDISILNFVVFTLKNCRNEQLLLDVAKISEILCSNSEMFLNNFAATTEFFESILEALNESAWASHSEVASRLINVLYMISTVEPFRSSDFAKCMTTNQNDVVSKLASYVVKIFPTETLCIDDISCAVASSMSLLLTLLVLISPSSHPLLFQNQDLWRYVGNAYRLLEKHRFSADEEQSPAAVLKLNVLDFVESVRTIPDINVEQYVLNKIL